MPRASKIPNVRFNLKSTKGNDSTLIYMVLQINGDRLKYSTGEKIIPFYWNDLKHAAKNIRGQNFTELNKRLVEMKSFAIEKIVQSDFKINVGGLRDLLNIKLGRIKIDEQPKVERPPTFIEFVDEYLKERKNSVAGKRGTWKVWQTSINHIKAFCKHEGTYYEKIDEKEVYSLNYDNLDKGFRNRFVNYLYKEKNHSINFVAKIISMLSQFMNEANLRDLPQKWDLPEMRAHRQKGWTVKKTKTTKFRLTFEELQAINDLELSGRIDIARSLFLIGAYTGLRYSDFSRLQPRHIIEEDGVRMIEIRTQKTGSEVTIPMFPNLEDIIELEFN
jgi:hypothetical protein